jgi:glycosyl transferase family 92
VNYLSICAIYRDEASYLAEWIEFHRLVGVERFYLNNNASEDDHLEVLAPYLADGTVVLHDAGAEPGRGGLQVRMYTKCLQERRKESRWIAFLDLDEFLFSPTGRPVPDLLADYEQWPAVGVNRAWFGTSGHRTSPPGLVLENYLQRQDRRGHSSVKSIVDPARTIECLNPHRFVFSEGVPIDESKRPFEGVMTQAYTYELLRVNHYYTKSEEECDARKQARLRQNPAFNEARPVGDEHAIYNQLDDETILMYLPALREALGERDGAKTGR